MKTSRCSFLMTLSVTAYWLIAFTAVGQAATVTVPEFSPAGGNYTAVQSVGISSSTSGAAIRYTSDGTAPSDTVGTVYSGPVTVNATTTLKAVAYASGLTNSGVATAVYNILVAPPSFSPAGGNYLTAQTVTLGTTTAGAAIRYTTDGSAPSDTVGTVCSGPVTVSTTTTLKAVAYASGLTNSGVATAVYNILVATPSFSPAGGNYLTAQTVTLSTTTAGATIRYTTDGSTPSDTVGTIYSGLVTVSATTTLKAVAYASGLTNSGVATAVYNILAAPPSFSPAGGNYLTAQTVTLSTITSGAGIRYTTDGSTPPATVGTIYSGPVTVSATTTLKAIGYASGLTNSGVATAVYNILVATPSFSPWGGNFLTAQTVTLSTTTAGATIRYTIDGSTPSATVGTVYSGPVTMSATTTLKAIAYASGLTNSGVATAVYNILVAPPSFSPTGGNYLTAQTVTLSTTTAGAAIRYTIDGSTPSDTVGTVYSGPVTVSATTTLKAVAYASGLTNSGVATAVYNILVAPPSFSPTGGNYLTAQTVTLSTATSGASIRYTTDESAPSDTVGTVYSGPVTVSATTTLKAIAYASGLTNSGVATAVYNILAATPSITGLSPTSGAVGTAVTISGSNCGAIQGSSTVTFNGALAGTALSWGATSIVVFVPSGAATGNVVVTVGGMVSNGMWFAVPTAVTLAPNLLNLMVGDTRTLPALSAAGQPATGLSWTSSDPPVWVLPSDDPPALPALAAGHVTIPAGTASANVPVWAGAMPVGTVLWSNPGNGSGVTKIVPAVPSPNGVADVFAFQADGTVQAITRDGPTPWQCA